MKNVIPFRQASCIPSWDFLGSKMCTGRSDMNRYLSRPFAGILLPGCSNGTLRCENCRKIAKLLFFFLPGEDFSVMMTCLGKSGNPNLVTQVLTHVFKNTSKCFIGTSFCILLSLLQFSGTVPQLKIFLPSIVFCSLTVTLRQNNLPAS